MGTYILSFIFFAFVLSCFYKKRSYENRFAIALYSAAFSLVPLVIVNLKTNNNGERSLITIRSWPLAKVDSLQRITSGDTLPKSVPVYFTADVKEESLDFKPIGHDARSKSLLRKDLIIHYIKSDSINVPRYEVTAEKLKASSRSRWVSTIGIPNKNRKMHLYLPNDTTSVILNSVINEIKKNNTN